MIPPPAWQERASKLREGACIYLLRSIKTGRFYVGWTTDLERRLQEHNLGESPYTKSRGPWELIDYEVYPDVQSAKERERTLKHNPRMLFYFKKRALATQRVSTALRRSRQVVG